MSETKINATQIGGDVYTSNSLRAGSNITIEETQEVGSYDVSGFDSSSSYSQYISLDGATYFNTATANWEFVIKAKSPTTSGGHYLCGSRASSGSATQYKVGVGLNLGYDGTNPGIQLSMGLSSNGSSWDIGNGWQYNTDNPLEAETWYWIKVSFNGSVYKLQYSTDGKRYTDHITVSSSTNIYQTRSTGTVLAIGTRGSSSTSHAFGGTIDLRGTYIKIAGSYTFNGATQASLGDFLVDPHSLLTVVETPSGGSYNAINADFTSIYGYSSNKTQVLKNINGSLTWVDEA